MEASAASFGVGSTAASPGPPLTTGATSADSQALDDSGLIGGFAASAGGELTAGDTDDTTSVAGAEEPSCPAVGFALGFTSLFV